MRTIVNFPGMLWFVCLLVFPGTVFADTSVGADSDAIAVARLYADSADVTHFADEAIEWLDAAEPDGMLAVTALLPASQVGFLRIGASYRSDWHPAPRKQYVLVLRGTVEVEAGDGEKRLFEPGSVLLVTDTAGRGHRTNAIGDEDVLLAWVPVP